MAKGADIRIAAFYRVQQLQRAYGDAIPWAEIEKGFEFEGDKVSLASKAEGIFKPSIMRDAALSIKTVMPRQGRVNIYRDHIDDRGYYHYALASGDPLNRRNMLLWNALKENAPLIYFHGVYPTVYSAIWPCFIQDIDPAEAFAKVVVGNKPVLSATGAISEEVSDIPFEAEKRYLTIESKRRLHQASFREVVIREYKSRCAISGMPVSSLLEAAHIIPDSNKKSTAGISNGIALSRIHHKAYDANLIGITPDYKVLVSDKLMEHSENALVKNGILSFHDKKMRLPNRYESRPNQDFLAVRYEEFKKAGF